MQGEQNREPEREMDRRDCLAWIARAVAAACVTRACGDSAQADEKGLTRVGSIMTMPNLSVRELQSPEAFLIRTDSGIAALSTYCTHKRNKLSIENGTIACPVHNSVFDFNGDPQGGPASKPLSWFHTQVDEDGNIFVDASRTVAQGQWGALPAWAQPKKP